MRTLFFRGVNDAVPFYFARFLLHLYTAGLPTSPSPASPSPILRFLPFMFPCFSETKCASASRNFSSLFRRNSISPYAALRDLATDFSSFLRLRCNLRSFPPVMGLPRLGGSSVLSI